MKLTHKSKLGQITFAVIGLLLIIACMSLYLMRATDVPTNALRELGVTIYPEPKPIEHFKLLDQNSEPFTPARLKGQWSLIFFGFTACPDICPLTMAELRQFYVSLESANLGQLPQVVLVTVDPARDNPETLASYVGNFHEDFVGLSGDAITLSDLAAQMYVAHTQVPGHSGHELDSTTSSNYLIEHSWHISMINPSAELYAVFHPPYRDSDLLNAYQTLVTD